MNLRIVPLEMRIVFDAAVVAAVAEAVESSTEGDFSEGEGIHQEGALMEHSEIEVSEEGGPVEITLPGDQNGVRLLLVSSQVKDYLKLGDAAKEGVKVVYYDAEESSLQDILTLIEAELDGEKADSIAFANEGNHNQFFLTENQVMNLTLLSNSESLNQFWKSVGEFVSEDGRIDLLACRIASGNEGSLMVDYLENATGRNVAASSNDTGNSENGGDWVLETDGVDAEALYFNTQALSNWTQLLAFPIAGDDFPVTDEDTSIIFDVLVNDDDSGDNPTPDDPVVYLEDDFCQGFPLPGPDSTPCPPNFFGQITDLGNGNFQYNPQGLFDHLAAGQFFLDSFQYIAEDAVEDPSNIATVTVTVNGVNDNPVANPDSGTATVGGSDAISALSNDTDVDSNSNNFTITTITTDTDSDGRSGSVVNVNGVLNYTPGIGFSTLTAGETAIDTFSYLLNDGNGGSSLGTVSVTVVGIASTGSSSDGGDGASSSTTQAAQAAASTVVPQAPASTTDAPSNGDSQGLNAAVSALAGASGSLGQSALGFFGAVKTCDTGSYCPDMFDKDQLAELPGLEAPDFLSFSSFSYDSDKGISLKGDQTIQFVDPEGEEGQKYQVSLKVTQGNITFAEAEGIEFVEGDGEQDNQMIFTGTLGDINKALDGMVYRFEGTEGEVGPKSIVVSLGDADEKEAPAKLTKTISVAFQPEIHFQDLEAIYTQSSEPLLLAPLAQFKDVDSFSFEQGALIVDFTDPFGKETGTAFDQLTLGEDDSFKVLDGSQVMINGRAVGFIIGGQNGTPLVIQFNDNSTPEDVASVLRHASYSNSSSTPDVQPRVTRFTVIDGDGKSFEEYKFLSINTTQTGE